MTSLQWFFAGMMAGWAPCLIWLAILLAHAPTLREDEETPRCPDPGIEAWRKRRAF